MTTASTDTPEEGGQEKISRPLFELSRRVLLAGIGAVSLAQDEVEDFVNKLIERGELAEKDGRKLMREIMDKRKKHMEEAEGEIGKRVEEVLDRMNVPSKGDIEALSEKIAALSRKIDELKKNSAQ